ncbi:HNH endonuclease [Streptomyces sp. NPDC046977]|uniref:HNH endonuclease n=1 Tax=Streptomyces sp. NPDC046977 TaxID=3154703 RepID=UPI0033E2B1AE
MSTSTHLHLVNGCPPWCRTDHTAPRPAEDDAHIGETVTLQLPDGREILAAELTLEPGAALPSVAVSLDEWAVNVAELDVAQMEAYIGRLQSYTMRLQQMIRPLRGGGRKAKSNPGMQQRQAWKEMRLYLAERDGWQCHYCRTSFDCLKGVSIDHYVPKSVWACNLPANLVLACRDCNERKGDTLPRTFAALLLAGYGHLAAEYAVAV